MTLWLTDDDAANTLLAQDPLALLLGMLLDQQIPMEKAFRGPQVLRERLGHLDAVRIAEHDPEAFATVMATPPAVHRFPGSMAKRVQDLCRALAEQYGGRAEAVWEDATDGPELLRRMQALPGFGTQKAQIFVALLGKQWGVQPDGWREAAGGYGEDGATKSVADVVSPETLLEVRAYKQSVKAAAKKKPRPRRRRQPPRGSAQTSTSTVNGPSLTDATCICAPNRPVATTAPRARSAATTASTSGSATPPGAAAAHDGRRPLRVSP